MINDLVPELRPKRDKILMWLFGFAYCWTILSDVFDFVSAATDSNACTGEVFKNAPAVFLLALGIIFPAFKGKAVHWVLVLCIVVVVTLLSLIGIANYATSANQDTIFIAVSLIIFLGVVAIVIQYYQLQESNRADLAIEGTSRLVNETTEKINATLSENIKKHQPWGLISFLAVLIVFTIVAKFLHAYSGSWMCSL